MKVWNKTVDENSAAAFVCNETEKQKSDTC